MRDRDGIVQVCFDPKYQEALTAASGLRNEFCIQIKGEVIARPDNQINKKYGDRRSRSISERITHLQCF